MRKSNRKVYLTFEIAIDDEWIIRIRWSSSKWIGNFSKHLPVILLQLNLKYFKFTIRANISLSSSSSHIHFLETKENFTIFGQFSISALRPGKFTHGSDMRIISISLQLLAIILKISRVAPIMWTLFESLRLIVPSWLNRLQISISIKNLPQRFSTCFKISAST